MTNFARIEAGTVREIFTVPAGKAIDDCFAPGLVWADLTEVSPQPAEGWTAVSTGGVWTFAAPAGPSLVQWAAGLAAAGLTIASTSTPAVNGVYLCDPATRATMAEIAAGIAAGHGFPGGGAVFDFDVAGGHVTFPSTTLFLAVAVAVRDFVYGCNQVAMGRSTTLPAASVTVA